MIKGFASLTVSNSDKVSNIDNILEEKYGEGFEIAYVNEGKLACLALEHDNKSFEVSMDKEGNFSDNFKLVLLSEKVESILYKHLEDFFNVDFALTVELDDETLPSAISEDTTNIKDAFVENKTVSVLITIYVQAKYTPDSLKELGEILMRTVPRAVVQIVTTGDKLTPAETLLGYINSLTREDKTRAILAGDNISNFAILEFYNDTITRIRPEI
jgi:hypothetical protein